MIASNGPSGSGSSSLVFKDNPASSVTSSVTDEVSAESEPPRAGSGVEIWEPTEVLLELGLLRPMPSEAKMSGPDVSTLEPPELGVEPELLESDVREREYPRTVLPKSKELEWELLQLELQGLDCPVTGGVEIE